jgi:hypothetical protein
MGRGAALLLAVLTAWPPVYCVFFMLFIFRTMAFGFGDGEGPDMFTVIFPLHFLTMLIGLVLLVVYIVHLFKADNVPGNQKALWAVVLFMGGMIAMPIYWYLHIWRPCSRSRLGRSTDATLQGRSAAPRSAHRAASRWVLLLAVALALVVCAAFAVWLACFRNALTPSEESAIRAIRAYRKAETLYRGTDHDRDGELEYADTLEKLLEAELIPKELARARDMTGRPHAGYLFMECKRLGVLYSVDWRYDFALCATPARYGEDARRTFIVRTYGPIWAKDLGRREFVLDFPDDPAAEGWEEVE